MIARFTVSLSVGLLLAMAQLSACGADDPVAANAADAALLDETGASGDGGLPEERETGPTAPSPILGYRDRVGRPWIARLLVDPSLREAYNEIPVDVVLS